MKTPWTSFADLEPDREYHVLASSIPPVRRSATLRMFRGSSAVRSQLRATEGVVGYALSARPWRKEYATLSVWVDAAALRAFAATSPHREIMGALAPEMGPTRFVEWSIRGDAGLPTWSEAFARLAGSG